ncbi:hypothetical protein BDV23DRAFT_161928 [Aspergillus alliaceus]|uniref:Uncharacterized protein n=1 Tax=Petromyces alliaceus TaxID=209559 RepID=A0A5N6FGB3_PETAA|nr:uncharacterized protein BDW43DRAFT_289553 [Aspergillus alliaceus]KAB8228996.1 hypothetical protein BDW43DRAFT_289553 [Aspergillus alliaceus]KAE8387099.1 hypothetical protein BDV23DRAFT_161928 [Aspergillus alliaceus]
MTENPSIREGGTRPYVVSYVDRPKFHVGDLVYVVGTDGLEGPFTVASVPATDACTLCDEDGNPAKEGSKIKMADLAAA